MVMVVVQALAAGDDRPTVARQVAGMVGRVEVPVSPPMPQPVDYTSREKWNPRHLDQPHHHASDAEDQDIRDQRYSGPKQAQRLVQRSLQPVGGRALSVLVANRLVVRRGLIKLGTQQHDTPDAEHDRTVRITIAVYVRMVASVDRDPLFGGHRGAQPQPGAHEMSDSRVERHGAVGLAAVQIQRDARGRQVGIEQRDEDVQQNRCASERRVREKEQLALRRNEIKSQYDTSATTIHSERFGPDATAAHDGGRDIIDFPMRRCVALLCALGLAATVSAGCTSAVTSPSNNVPFSSTNLVVGTGATASVGKALTVNYTGWLYDATQPENKGLVFDTS